jgi:hypothetical protein
MAISSLQAHSLDLSTAGHLNKMPFSGVLTKIDQPSDGAPSATSDKGGHRVTATHLIEQAMSEVQAGINFAAKGFGD